MGLYDFRVNSLWHRNAALKKILLTERYNKLRLAVIKPA